MKPVLTTLFVNFVLSVIIKFPNINIFILIKHINKTCFIKKLQFSLKNIKLHKIEFAKFAKNTSNSLELIFNYSSSSYKHTLIVDEMIFR